MDPLYVDYDKRKSLQENPAPAPIQASNSMPVFGSAAPAQTPTAPVTQATPVIPPAAPAAPAAPVAPTTYSSDPIAASFNNYATPTPTPGLSFEEQFEQALNEPAGGATAPVQQAPFQAPAQTPIDDTFNPNYTGNGDIVLDMSSPKKENKTLFLVVIVAAVLVIIGAMVFLLTGGFGGGNAKGDRTAAIEDYVNYYKNGNGDQDSKKQSINVSYNDKYFSELETKLDALLNYTDDEITADDINSQKQYLEFFKFSRRILYRSYLDADNNYSAQKESGFLNQEYAALDAYVQERNLYYEDLATYGCLDEQNNIDKQCERDIGEDFGVSMFEKKKELEKNISDIYEKINNYTEFLNGQK